MSPGKRRTPPAGAPGALETMSEGTTPRLELYSPTPTAVCADAWAARVLAGTRHRTELEEVAA